MGIISFAGLADLRVDKERGVHGTWAPLMRTDPGFGVSVSSRVSNQMVIRKAN